MWIIRKENIIYAKYTNGQLDKFYRRTIETSDFKKYENENDVKGLYWDEGAYFINTDVVVKYLNNKGYSVKK